MIFIDFINYDTKNIIIKSTVGLTLLLRKRIGGTIRISMLSGNPSIESVITKKNKIVYWIKIKYPKHHCLLKAWKIAVRIKNIKEILI
ncbi:MAG: hypothetical protein LBP70_00880 [Mycoplasmataceae bacterium]|nr:hypothetical protein [Mycoplasmataceae bacterium]